MGPAPARSLRRAGGCSKRGAERGRPEHLPAEGPTASNLQPRNGAGTSLDA
jgi:hypothetical protein